jgi:serine/threonine protein kinase
VYSYEHLAISLGCIVGAMKFNKADIVTICKELLEGLVYLYEILEVVYGFLDCSNIILTSGGEVKIGKYR